MIYDVIVVGGGAAGLMAALAAKDGMNRVAVITKSNILKSNSAVASGGINAVLDENNKESIEKHIDDTLKSAKGLADRKTVNYMCREAPRIIKKLTDYGVKFDSDENGNILQRNFGGSSENRTCFVGDNTGSAITQTLIKRAKLSGIELLQNVFVMDIVKTKNRISGIIALKRVDSSVIVYLAKAVIFAAGGYAGIYRGFSTNAQDTNGDILAVALRSGLMLEDLEFVQFHPTGFAKSGALISEAARAEGALLVNGSGESFINELDTRDVISRAIFNEIQKGEKVYIDMRHIDKERLLSRVPSLYKNAFNLAGVDISSELLEIRPVAHYSMGGIKSDFTTTDIKGLFVCGECAALGIHGANRLGGNSLLEAVVFGELAGKKAKEFSQNRSFLPIDYDKVIKNINLVQRIFEWDATKNFNAIRISAGKTMYLKAGIIRDKEKLEEALDYIKYLRLESASLHCMDKSRENNVELVAILELRNILQLSEAVILSALFREESRGAHFRSDFADMDAQKERHVLVKQLEGRFFKLQYEDGRLIRFLSRFFQGV
ncbi:MAG: FAD-dependent oxidoreductase [Campylobacteraceae bacterium]|jgi:succinate dehydrogenase/fumarate reductase flavoprotein subunit|nr:FAD-dependent oxidoreductase [Campylobacteraceae bacterium]